MDVAGVLAVVGAITGVTALGLQAWQFHLSGPRVKVTPSNALKTAQMRWAFSLDVTNPGRMPVTVEEVGVLLGGGRKIPLGALNSSLWSGPSLPHRLLDAEAATWLADPVALAHGAISEGSGTDVRVYARLATGKQKRSRRRFDIANLARIAQQR